MLVLIFVATFLFPVISSGADDNTQTYLNYQVVKIFRINSITFSVLHIFTMLLSYQHFITLSHIQVWSVDVSDAAVVKVNELERQGLVDVFTGSLYTDIIPLSGIGGPRTCLQLERVRVRVK